jgi:hypothetical protein
MYSLRKAANKQTRIKSATRPNQGIRMTSMLKFILIPLFFMFSLFSECLSQGSKTSRPLAVKIGYVTDTHATEGCGCSFYLPGEENKTGAKSILSLEDFGEAAWMNLNGKDVRIKQIKSTESLANLKKGRRFYKIYRYGDMQIRIDHHVTWTCESDMPESESCEVTDFDLTFTFSQKGQTHAIRAKGICGC